MIDDTAAGVARAAAEALAPRYGPRLETDVEAAIHANGGSRAGEPTAPDQYFDPIALGALIVALAQFGYQVYSDHKKKGQPPTRETIARALRIERRKHSDLSSEEAEVIDIVSAEIIERGDDDLSGPDGTARRQAAGDDLGASACGHLSRRQTRHAGPANPVQHELSASADARP